MVGAISTETQMIIQIKMNLEEIIMRIGVLIPFRATTDIDLEFKKVRDLELDCAQLSCWDVSLFNADVAKEIVAASEKYGVEITTLWCGYRGPAIWNNVEGPSTLGLVPPEWRGVRYLDLEKGSDFAEMLGVKMMATHVGFLPNNPNDPNYIGTVHTLKALCMKMQRRGQTFLFETGQETPVTLVRAIEDIGLDNVGINFDTANLILYGMARSSDAVDMFGKYIKDTHIKDGVFPSGGRELGHETRLGDGLADIPTIVSKMKAIGYEGAYIIEREISGEKQIEDIIHARDILRSLA